MSNFRFRVDETSISHRDDLRRLVREYAETWSGSFRVLDHGEEKWLLDLPGSAVPPKGNSWVAYAGATAVGCVLLLPDVKERRNYPEIAKLYVHPQWRRSGIGRELVRTACRYAFDQGAPAVYLLVQATRAGALALYESLGFVTVGQLEEGYVEMILLSSREPRSRPAP